jgi:hypothetical protein
MYCSGCGQVLTPGQTTCPQCDRAVGAPVPVVPGLAYQLESYSGKVKALSIVWFVYAALSVAWGLAGLAFAGMIFSVQFGPWMNGPWAHGPFPPGMLGPAFIRFAWIAVLVRAGLALAAGWGLYEHAQWGRIVAIVAAILSLLKFPLGTALGIWTLVVLLGYRNTTLYEQL